MDNVSDAEEDKVLGSWIDLGQLAIDTSNVRFPSRSQILL